MVDSHWMDNWINLIIVAVAFTIPSVGAFFSSYNNSSGVGVEFSTSNDMYIAATRYINDKTLNPKTYLDNNIDSNHMDYYL